MKTYHILNGDALKEQLAFIEGEQLVCRECLIDGPVDEATLAAFKTQRGEYLQNTFNITSEDYEKASEDIYTHIAQVEQDAEVNLWFEYDLFCQVNLWFTISILKDHSKLYLVFPNHKDWKGFGMMSEKDFRQSLLRKKKIGQEEILHFVALWEAYQKKNWKNLRQHAKALKSLVWHIEEVVEAHIDRFPKDSHYGRPQQSLLKIMADQEIQDFPDIFQAFSKKEGIYGFGDVQVHAIWSALNQK